MHLGHQAVVRGVPERRWRARERAWPRRRSQRTPGTVRPPSPAEPVEERCELCAEPIADGARPPGRPARPATSCAPAAGCYLLFTSEGAGRPPLPGRARPLPGVPRLRAVTAAQWDCLQIPVGVAFFFLNSALGRVAAFYPGPAGATESELPLDTWEELVAPYPGWPTSSPTSRPSWSGPTAGGRRDRSASSCPSTPATSWSATCGCVAGLRRGHARPGTHLDAFFAAVRDEGPMTDLAFEVVGGPGRAARRGADHHAGVCEATDDPRAATRRDALALRCQIRIEPQRRRYRPRRRSASTNCSARRPVGRLPPALPVDPRLDDGRPVRRLHRVRPADRSAPTTSRWPGPSTSHSLADGEIPLVLLFSGTVFTRGTVGLRGGAHLLGPRGLLPDAGRGVAGGDGHVLPQQRLAAGRPRHPRPAPALPGLPGPARPGTRPSSTCLQEAGEDGPVTEPSGRPLRPGPGGRRRRALRGLRALSLPGLVGQEPGALAVRRAHAAGLQRRDGSERWSARTECLVRPGPTAAMTVRIRCLQLQRARRRGAGPDSGPSGRRFVPVGPPRGGRDRSTSTGTRPSTRSSTSDRSRWRPWWRQGTSSRSRSTAGTESELIVARPRGRPRAGWCVRRHRWSGRVRVARRAGRRRAGLVKGDRRPSRTPPHGRHRRAGRDDALGHALLAVHAMLAVDDGTLRLPPRSPRRAAAAAAAACRSDGTYPVLIGDDDVVLSSPIILYDHPEVAPESPATSTTPPRSTRSWPCGS